MTQKLRYLTEFACLIYFLKLRYIIVKHVEKKNINITKENKKKELNCVKYFLFGPTN